MKFKQLKAKQAQSLLIAAVLSVVIAAPVMSQPLGLTAIMTTSIPEQVSPAAEEPEAQPEVNMLAAPESIDTTSDGLSRSQSENDLVPTEEIETTLEAQADAQVSAVSEPTTAPEPVETSPAYTGPEFTPQDKILYVSASELNMRQSFSSEANIVEKIQMGQKVKCIGESEEWLRVEYNGRTGYVAAEFTSAEMVFVPVDQTRYVDATGLNVRAQPNAEAEVLAKLSKDDKVKRIGVGDGWSLVKTSGGTEGYVSSEYLTETVPASVIAAQQAAQAASQPKSSPVVSNPGAVVGNADINTIVEIAWSGLGVPYVGGGSSLSGFDCSGYTSWIYRQVGINISRSSYSYLNVGMEVPMSDIRPGDIIAMDTNRGDGRTVISHVGIYVGGGQVLHASWNRQRIAPTDLGSLSAYGMQPVSVRRIVN